MYKGLLHSDKSLHIIQSQLTSCQHLAGSGLGLCYMTSDSVPLPSQQVKTWDGFKGILKDNPSTYTNTSQYTQQQVQPWSKATREQESGSDTDLIPCTDVQSAMMNRENTTGSEEQTQHSFFTVQKQILAMSHDFLCSWRHVGCRIWLPSSCIHCIPSPLWFSYITLEIMLFFQHNLTSWHSWAVFSFFFDCLVLMTGTHLK